MKQVTIGVVLDSDFEYGVAVYEGIRHAAAKLAGWSLAPFTQPMQSLLLRLARSARLDGIILPVVSDRWVAPLLEVLPAVVNISGISRVESVSTVVTDDYAAGELAAAHMVEMGVRRCAILCERSLHSSVRRRDGFRAVMDSAGIEILDPHPRDAYSYEVSWEQWLGTLSGEIGVYGTSDRMVARFMHLYNTLGHASSGVSIGAIVGTGDSLTERTLSGIDLSSVALPGVRIGVEAVNRMRCLLAGDEIRRVEIKPDELKVRGSSTGAAGADAVISRARGYIERNIAGSLGVDEIARRIGVSRRTLELHFRTHLRISPAEYIRGRRMKLAARLLRESDLTVGQIALRCGAGSPQAFTTAFGRVYKMPPAAYRAGKIPAIR